MKKLLWSAAFLLALAGCKEENNLINLTGNSSKEDVLYISDSSQSASVPAAQSKRVLIEDFTGVRCVNCPNAQKEAMNIIQQHPGLVSAVSVHVTSFAVPYDKSKFDFRTQEGTNLLSAYGGEPNALPSGDVDRVVYSGNDNVYINYNEWSGHVGNELSLSTPVNITIDTTKFDSTTRRLDVVATVTYTKAVSTPLYASMLFIESGITDWQYSSTGWDSAYVQNHVLRKIAQPQTGLKLNGAAKAGQSYHLRYTTYLPAGWNAHNVEVLTIVQHKTSGTTPATTDLSVVQVQEKEIE